VIQTRELGSDLGHAASIACPGARPARFTRLG
jgi:hypothetical protein